MTGRIRSLGAGSVSGFIHAENGLNVHFEPSAVLAYDVACLAVGQMVTFDFEGGNSGEAVNVYVLKSRPVSTPAVAKSQEPSLLRYAGFEQKKGLRAYRFERRSPGEETAVFIVTVDLTLFAKHRIAIQEGPALCLRLLTGDSPQLESSLTEEDLLAHVARKPAPVARRRPIPRKPAPVTPGNHKSW
jgi:cold shock CspA family protein